MWKIFIIKVLTREQPITDNIQPTHCTSRRPHKEDITSDMRQNNHEGINFKAFDKQECDSSFCSATEPRSGDIASPALFHFFS